MMAGIERQGSNRFKTIAKMILHTVDSEESQPYSGIADIPEETAAELTEEESQPIDPEVAVLPEEQGEGRGRLALFCSYEI